MYKLTLTKSERDAFDWVGDRYNSGRIACILLTCLACQINSKIPTFWEDEENSYTGDIDFYIPEHKAWEINDLAEQEDYLFPCFDIQLTTKLNDFCLQIV